jgi:hypothetical protein
MPAASDLLCTNILREADMRRSVLFAALFLGLAAPASVFAMGGGGGGYGGGGGGGGGGRRDRW